MACGAWARLASSLPGVRIRHELGYHEGAQGGDREQARARLNARLMSFDAALRALRSPPDYPM
jgi:hypothetical protein